MPASVLRSWHLLLSQHGPLAAAGCQSSSPSTTGRLLHSALGILAGVTRGVRGAAGPATLRELWGEKGKKTPLLVLPTPRKRGGDFAGGETEAQKREGSTRSCLLHHSPAQPLQEMGDVPSPSLASSFSLLNRKASLWSLGLLSPLPQVTIAVTGVCCCLRRTPLR